MSKERYSEITYRLARIVNDGLRAKKETFCTDGVRCLRLLPETERRSTAPSGSIEEFVVPSVAIAAARVRAIWESGSQLGG